MDNNQQYYYNNQTEFAQQYYNNQFVYPNQYNNSYQQQTYYDYQDPYYNNQQYQTNYYQYPQQQTKINYNKKNKIFSLSLFFATIVIIISGFFINNWINDSGIKTQIITNNAKESTALITIKDNIGDLISLGSGVYINNNGYILTNEHVIATKAAGETTNSVVVNIDGEEYPAEVVGKDTLKDLAVIKINKSDTKAIETANSDTVAVGEKVYAIGNPLGLDKTVTEGIISAKNRIQVMENPDETSEVKNKVYINMIQTDAAINPGNSGGVLLNKDGKLIGINSVIMSVDGLSSGLGFAIPINEAKTIANKLMNGEQIVYPKLGIQTKTITPKLARENGYSETNGIVVQAIQPDSAASKSELQVGDIITGLEVTIYNQTQEVPIHNTETLIALLTELKPGDTITLKMTRGTEKLSTTVVLE